MAIEVKNRQQFANAIEKARKVKPFVLFVDFGHYQVCGASQWYTVQFSRDEQGHRWSSCSCRADEGGSGEHDPLPCYHAAAAMGHHILEAKKREEDAGGPPPARLCQVCGALDGLFGVKILATGLCAGCELVEEANRKAAAKKKKRPAAKPGSNTRPSTCRRCQSAPALDEKDLLCMNCTASDLFG
jgi:hypothetical protein